MQPAPVLTPEQFSAVAFQSATVGGDGAADAVLAALEAATRRLLAGEPAEAPVAVLFSGGPDSSLVAAQLVRLGHTPRLILVAQPGAADLAPGQAAARALGLPLEVVSLDAAQLAARLPAALQENRSPALHGVVMHLIEQLASDAARAHGCRALWTGIGADLLFSGGRAPDRYEGAFGSDAWQVAYWQQTLPVWHWRFCQLPRWARLPERGLAQLSPLATPEMIRCARSISPDALWLSDGAGGWHDKAPLRAAAQRLGVPEEVAWRPKDPAQRSSGLFATLTELMLAEADRVTDHQVAHPARPEDDPLLALRIWMAWQADRAGVRAAAPEDGSALQPQPWEQLRARIDNRLPDSPP